jgi:hypothetical protein
LPDGNNTLVKVPVSDVNETGRYSGVPLGLRRLAKMKFKNDNISKIQQILSRVKDTCTKIPRITNAIKTIIPSRLEYCMLNSIVSKTVLDKLDK